MKFENFSKSIFSNLTVCLSSNKKTVYYLRKLGAKNIKYFGNLKYAQSENEKVILEKNIINFFKNKTNELSILPIGLLLLQVFIYSMHNGHLGDFPFFWMMIGIVAGSNYRLKQASTVESN